MPPNKPTPQWKINLAALTIVMVILSICEYFTQQERDDQLRQLCLQNPHEPSCPYVREQ